MTPRPAEILPSHAAEPYRLIPPISDPGGVVVSSPHSGNCYFTDFIEETSLELAVLRASEDAYVDALFGAAAGFGAPVLAAVAPRAYVDLNRAPSELDPLLIDGAPPHRGSARVLAGLGVIPRIVAEGVPIYARKLSALEARRRIARWHAPYHQRLVELLLDARRRCDRALLIDCHSMPRGASGRVRGGQPDIILGDRFGAAADSKLVAAIEACFADAGFRVTRNAPFAGGYITERYGRPHLGVHAVQIEVDRRLYMDERTIEPTEEFASLARRFRSVIAEICALAAPQRPLSHLAAE